MSSFVKHPRCKERCEAFGSGRECVSRCEWLEACVEGRTIFDERDTDQESRLDRKARARECK